MRTVDVPDMYASSAISASADCVSFRRTARVACVVATVLAAGTAFAQTSASGGDSSSGSQTSGQLQEIVVTAERRKESLQQTPVSISVVTPQSLARNSTRTLQDLTGEVPGLIVGGKLTGGGNEPITIRGVSGQNVLTGVDPAVSIYLDGVYLSRPDAAFFTLADVQRIEVLEGPQGTLYGRNATAGAINIITRNPSVTKWEGTLDGNYGNYGGYEGRGYVGGPLGGGFAASVSVAASGNDGYFRNSVTGRDLNGDHTLTLRGKIRYVNRSGDFDAVLTYDHTRDTGNLAYFVYGYGQVSNFQYLGVSNPGETYSAYSNYNFDNTMSKGSSLTLNYRPSDQWTLTSITGWRDMTTKAFYSVTPPGGFPLLHGLGVQSLNDSMYGPSVSQEFRAVYVGERLNLTTGLSYYTDKVWSQFGGAVEPLSAPPANLNTVATAPIVQTNTNSYAAYAQIDYHFVPKLTGTLGVRANHEDRSMFEEFPAVPGQPTLQSAVKNNKLIPKVGLSYQESRDLMFYGSVSDGYQAPGQSYSATPTAPILVVAPEKLIAYEVGFKSEWDDHKLRLNAAAFYYDYDPLQVRVTTGLNQFNIVGVAARLYGAQLDGAAVLAPGLVLSGNLVGLHSQYTHFCDNAVPFDPANNCNLPGTSGAPNGVSRAGNPLNQAPDWTFNLALSYQRPLANSMGLDLNGSYTYTGKYYSSESALAYTRADAIGRLNLRAGLTFADGLDVYVFGRNLTNEVSQGALIYTALIGNVLDTGIPTPPRTYGVGLHYSF